MELTLSSEERATLMTTLGTAYTELRDELSTTDSYELREWLKHTAEVLAGMLDRLDPGWTALHGMQLRAPQSTRG
jgi:hypothetical protein